MEKKRSKGVTIFAWFFIIGGSSVIIPLIIDRDLTKSFYSLSNPVVFILMLYTICVSTACIIAGINSLKLKEWSRKLIIALGALSIINLFLFGSLYSNFFRVIVLIYLVSILIFFTRPKVKEQFK